MRYKPLIDRLIPNLYLGERDECWPWQGARSKHGYPVVWGDGKNHLAHRRIYEMFYGLPFYSLTPSQVVMHKCDRPSCCNPLHLKLGTQLENTADRDKKGRQKAPKGERHGMSKLTADQVLEIRSAPSAAGLAKKYGVSRSLIFQVRANKIWTHV